MCETSACVGFDKFIVILMQDILFTGTPSLKCIGLVHQFILQAHYHACKYYSPINQL